MTSYCVNLTAMSSFLLYVQKIQKKKKKMKTLAVTYFQAKNVFFFLEKGCFPPVCLISHSATCIDLGEIIIYVCNATVVPLSFKKTLDQTQGGI